MDLSIERVEHDGVVVLVCTGRLDAETGDDLAGAVADELRRGYHAIRLDLDATTFLSSAGIRGLFETQRSAKAAGASCFILRASPVVRRVLDLTRLTPILMEGQTPQPDKAVPAHAAPVAADVTCGAVNLLGVERPTGAGVRGAILGSPNDAVAGRAAQGGVRPLSRHGCGLGLASIADGQAAADRAGEMAAVAGAVFHRPPQPHAAIDYVVPTGDLLAEVNVLCGLIWEGIPTGHAGFEPAEDEPFVRLDDLIEAVLAQTDATTIAIVVAGEVHGLVGAELIRPLGEARDGDTPVAGTRDVAATWLSFSREPVYARHTAVIVGVVTRGGGFGLVADFVRPVPDRGFSSHCHAVVFPYRPLRRGGLDLPATVADLAASTPLAVLHLVADPHPVLGSGRSELARGGVWFAPLDLVSGEATA
jgi:anti-anti-sigma factor